MGTAVRPLSHLSSGNNVYQATCIMVEKPMIMSNTRNQFSANYGSNKINHSNVYQGSVDELESRGASSTKNLRKLHSSLNIKL